ncbi:methyltransferase domain-containing protein [Pendulispora rubella]|uniref:Methyltransferase domain-containing protein n=1 Tax=Pendulispora rubella TaxID=2741070 RepID=A0ABZ2KPU6_9BACT
MSQSETKFIPAMGFSALTPFYDRLSRMALDEEGFKSRLIREARLAPGHRVLDLGSGTGTLTIMLKKAQPGAEIVGLDVDPAILAIAEKKAMASNLDIEFRRGSAVAPPFEPSTFDRVVSSLVFHHLTRENKLRALRAAHALLKPGGELHIVDWGRAQNRLMRGAFLAVQLFDGFETTTDNVRGRLPDFIAEAGFTSVAEVHHQMTVFGTLALYRASRTA